MGEEYCVQYLARLSMGVALDDVARNPSHGGGKALPSVLWLLHMAYLTLTTTVHIIPDSNVS